MRYGSLTLIALCFASPTLANEARTKKVPRKTTLSSQKKLKSGAAKQNLVTTAQISSRVRKTDVRSTLKLSEKDLQNIQDHKDAIEAADFLIQKTAEGPARNVLIINKAISLFSLARFQSNQRKSLKIVEQDKQIFMEAYRQADRALVSSSQQPKIKARALFVKGLVQLYLDQNSRELFEESIRVDPQSEHAPWMSLVIAEDLFDKGDFARALPAYQRMYARFDRSQKELALYKMAWTYVNLNQNARAEKTFAQLIKASPRGNFSLDASRDLGYVVSQTHTQDEIVKMSEAVFGQDTERKIFFLTSVNGYYEAHGSVQLTSPVMRRLLELEKDPAKRAQYFISGVRSDKKPYASKAHLASFDQMSRVLDKAYVKKSEPLKEAVEIETQAILRAFLDTYYQKIRSPETFTKEELERALKYLLNFHISFLPTSKQSSEVYSVFIRLCENTNDDRCVFEIAERAQKDELVKDIHEFAAAAQLTALDKMQLTDPGKFRGLFLNKSQKFNEMYLESKDWLRVAKRRAEILMLVKRYSVAEDVYESVYDKEESAANFYNIQWARFQDEKYQEVLEDSRGKKYSEEPKHVELKREAALKIAIRARNDKDLKKYKKAIETFVELKPGPERENIARKDYMDFLSSIGNISELQEAVTVLSAKEKLNPSFSDHVHAVWLSYMETGDFEEAGDVEGRRPPSEKGFYRWVLAQWALGKKEVYDDIFMMSKGPQRLYLMNLSALLNPEGFVEAVDKSKWLKKPLVDIERDLTILALQLKHGQSQIYRDAQAEKLLGSRFSFAASKLESEDSLLFVEKKMKGIQVPDPKNPSPNYDKDLAAALDKIRALRKNILSDIKNESPTIKVRVLMAAAELEHKVGLALTEAPLPKGLNANEIQTYRNEVAKIAQEFFVQNQEFKKSAALLATAVQQDQYFQPSFKTWPWPSELNSRQMRVINEMLDSKNYISSLILLDLWAAKNPKKMEHYAWIRSGILLLSRDSNAMRAIVAAELKSSGNETVLKEWGAMNEKIKK